MLNGFSTFDKVAVLVKPGLCESPVRDEKVIVGEVDSAGTPSCQLLDTDRETFLTIGISWAGDMVLWLIEGERKRAGLF